VIDGRLVVAVDTILEQQHLTIAERLRQLVRR